MNHGNAVLLKFSGICFWISGRCEDDFYAFLDNDIHNFFKIRIKHRYVYAEGFVGCFLALNDVLTDRKSTRLNSSHVRISYAVFCLKKKKKKKETISESERKR